jgi:hypothetical protein
VDTRVPGSPDTEAQFIHAFEYTVRLFALVDLLNSPGMLKTSSLVCGRGERESVWRER